MNKPEQISKIAVADIETVSALSNTATSTLKLWKKTRPEYFNYLCHARQYYDTLTQTEIEELYACETHVQIAEYIGVLPTFTKDHVLAATTISNWLKSDKKERLVAIMLGAALVHFKRSNALTDNELSKVLNSQNVSFKDLVYVWQYRPTLLGVVLSAAT